MDTQAAESAPRNRSDDVSGKAPASDRGFGCLTPSPQIAPSCPAPGDPPAPLQFAVLRHAGHGPLHFDLLLELPQQDRLATWRVAAHPDTWPAAHTLPAQRRPDHRRHYLAYEGPVSGNRGTVTRVCAGTWTLTTLTPHTLAGTLHRPAGDVRFALERVATARDAANTPSDTNDEYRLVISH